MARTRNGEMILVYDQDRTIWVRHSRDDGKTWGAPIQVATWTHGLLTNAELLPLRSGALLCLYNARPDREAGHPFAICLARSHDNGRTWQPPAPLYEAGNTFADGCWEPAAVELPGGEVQVFFANESPYRASAEQEITLLRSRDGAARTWGHPETISFRAGSRDGMPVPVVLRGGRGIAVALEDNGLSGNFKPVIVFTSLADNWRSGPVSGQSPRRRGALRVPLAPGVYAGAPCLRQMPGGETLLSFQQSDGGDLKNAQMVVCVGDARARNFDNPSRPFPFTPGGAAAQLWNALFIKNRRTVCALSTTAINGVRGVWSIDGRLV